MEKLFLIIGLFISFLLPAQNEQPVENNVRVSGYLKSGKYLMAPIGYFDTIMNGDLLIVIDTVENTFTFSGGNVVIDDPNFKFTVNGSDVLRNVYDPKAYGADNTAGVDATGYFNARCPLGDCSKVFYPSKGEYLVNGAVTFEGNTILKMDPETMITGTGTLIGNNTIIDAGRYQIFGADINFSGTWYCLNFSPEWLGLEPESEYTEAIQAKINVLAFSGWVNVFYKPHYESYIKSDSGLIINGDTITGEGESIWTELGDTAIYSGSAKIDSLSVDRKGEFKNDSTQPSIIIGTHAGESMRNNTWPLGSYNNILIGNNAGKNGIYFDNNIAIGTNALKDVIGEDDSGDFNIAIGTGALQRGEYVGYSNAIGFGALRHMDEGHDNNAFGYRALYNIRGNYWRNDAFGYLALETLRKGEDNNAFGAGSLNSADSAFKNVAFGSGALYSLRDGSNNVAIGTGTGGNTMLKTNYSGTVLIGYKAGWDNTKSNVLYIDNSSANSDNALIYGEFDTDKLFFNADVYSRSYRINANPSDGTFSGYVVTMTAGTDLKFHDVCYIGSDGKMEKADANVDGHIPLFLCAEVIPEGAIGLFLTEGYICEEEDWDFKIGVPVYLSETPGALTTVKPSTAGVNIWIIGITTHADRFYFKPTLKETAYEYTHPKIDEFFDNFGSTGTGVGSGPSASNSLDIGDHPGIISIKSHASMKNSGYTRYWYNTGVYSGDEFTCSMYFVDTANSTSRLGFVSSVTISPSTQGAWFEKAKGSKLKTVVTSTVGDTTFSPALNTWYTFKVKYLGGGVTHFTIWDDKNETLVFDDYTSGVTPAPTIAIFPAVSSFYAGVPVRVTDLIRVDYMKYQPKRVLKRGQ